MKICLYSAIATQDENQLRDRSAWWELKAFAKRSRDRAKWQFTLDRTFEFDAWQLRRGTNRGDMAIRLSIKDLFCRVYGPDIDFVEYSWGALTAEAIDSINKTCDLFVIGGGGYLFTDSAGGLGNKRVPDDLVFLRSIACPKVAYGIGVNQVLNQGVAPPTTFNRTAAQAVGAWLTELDAVAVRDEATRGLISGLADKSIFLVGDPALFLEGHHAPRYHSGYVGLNFAVHGPRSASLFSKHFFKYVGALRKLQREDFLLKYIRHSEMDLIALRMFAAEGIELQLVDEPPRTLLTAYSEMDFVFSQMLHSAILATAVGVPSINTAYDRKNFAFYQLFGMEEFCIHEDAFSEHWLFDRIEKLRDSRARLSNELVQRKILLLAQHIEFLESVKTLIGVSHQ